MYFESNDELDDYEYPDENDLDDDPDEYTDACPNCDADVYDDADYCPHCGEFIPFDRSPFSKRPVIWTVLGVLGVSAVIAAIIFRSL